METLETPRLNIRPFNLGDLSEAHQVLDRDIEWAGAGRSLSFRREKLALYTALAEWEDTGRLYGYRALTLKPSGEIIGISGFHPDVWTPGWKSAFWPRLFPGRYTPAELTVSSLELNLGWALSKQHRGYGYASEAAGALLRYAFTELQIERVFAVTDRVNTPSIHVMQRIGMRVAAHPDPQIVYPGVAGVVENPRVEAGNF